MDSRGPATLRLRDPEKGLRLKHQSPRPLETSHIVSDFV